MIKKFIPRCFVYKISLISLQECFYLENSLKSKIITKELNNDILPKIFGLGGKLPLDRYSQEDFCFLSFLQFLIKRLKDEIYL